MAITTIANYTYFLGWIVGSLASVIGFTLSFYVILWTGKGKKTKAIGFMVGFMVGFIKTVIVLLFHTFYLFAVMTINVYFSNEKTWEFTFNAIVNPINFFTYLGGIALVPMGTITWAIMSKIRKGDNAKIRHSI